MTFEKLIGFCTHRPPPRKFIQWDGRTAANAGWVRRLLFIKEAQRLATFV